MWVCVTAFRWKSDRLQESVLSFHSKGPGMGPRSQALTPPTGVKKGVARGRTDRTVCWRFDWGWRGARPGGVAGGVALGWACRGRGLLPVSSRAGRGEPVGVVWRGGRSSGRPHTPPSGGPEGTIRASVSAGAARRAELRPEDATRAQFRRGGRASDSDGGGVGAPSCGEAAGAPGREPGP